MKKINIILIVSLILSIFLAGCCNYISIKEKIEIFNKQKAQHNTGFYDIGLKFYLVKNKYPNSINEYIEWDKPDSFGIEYFKREMKDPFLKNGQMLQYYPLYNDTTQNPVACVFLSVGEDGILNNKIKTKLLLKDWFKYINAYNIEDVIVELNKVEIRYPIYGRDGNLYRYKIELVKTEDIENGNVFIKGDTLYRDDKILESIKSKFMSQKPFFYQNYSIYRSFFGKKDYIVNWGYRVIEYEIVR